MRKLAILLVISVLGGYGQSSPQNIPPSSFGYFSYSPVPQPPSPVGSEFLLTFPNQAAGSQLTPASCSTYAALKYNHFVYDPNSSTWSGPLTGPVYGYFTMFGETKTPTTNWQGISADVNFGGIMGSNSSPSTQNFVQSVYFSTDNCFEYGPEFGFYRLFQNNTLSEQNTVYFYYGLNVNCYNVSSLGSCRDKATGASLIYNVVSQGLTVPSANSVGTQEFIYSAILTSPGTSWRVTVKDPFNNQTYVNTTVAVNPSGFFASTAQQLVTTGLTGYMTYTQQRNSPQGGITDSMTKPLKLTVFALSQIAASIIIPNVGFAGMQPASGWCMQGNQGIAAPVNIGGSPVQRFMQQSYPACTVTVKLTGTSTLATLFSDNLASPTPLANPFQSNSNGFWQFYSPNGTYDVSLSGGGLASPISIGSVELFDFSTWQPTTFYTHSLRLIAPNDSTKYTEFLSGSLSASISWTWPTADSAGCFNSNGSGIISIVGCGPGGPATSVQYNNSGSFGGTSNFVWDNTLQRLLITGMGGTAAIQVNNGYILSIGGFVSSVNNWVGFQSNTDGSLFRGYHLAPSLTGNTGGYVNISPLGYANAPAPLPGLSSFGVHTALLWVSPLNTMSGDTTNALNTNLYINAAGGFSVCTFTGGVCAATQYNSIQSQNGGMFAKSFTSLKYIQVGNSSGPPSLTSGDSFQKGAMYYDTILNAFQGYNGTTWGALGGGGGTPGGANTNVQFNSSGSFGGSSNFIWDNTNQAIQVTALDAAHLGLRVVNGYVQTDSGFVACNNGSGGCTTGTSNKYNSIQAPGGGMFGISFTATKYVQTGNNNGVPSLTSGDTFHAGAMYFDTGAAAEQLYNGSGWVSLGTGGGTPGGSNTQVQYNNAGSFAGSAGLTYTVGTQALAVGGAIGSGNTGTNITFQNSNFNFQVNGNGDVSGAGSFNATGGSSSYKMGGTVFVDVSRNATFPTLSNGVTGPSTCATVVDGSKNVCTQNLLMNGYVAYFHSIPTVGEGVPGVLYTNITTQTTYNGVNSGGVFMYVGPGSTAPPAGYYRVQANLICFTNCTVGGSTVTFSVEHDDGLGTWTEHGCDLNSSFNGATQTCTYSFYSNAGEVPFWYTTIFGVGSTPHYEIYVTMEKLY